MPHKVPVTALCPTLRLLLAGVNAVAGLTLLLAVGATTAEMCRDGLQCIADGWSMADVGGECHGRLARGRGSL